MVTEIQFWIVVGILLLIISLLVLAILKSYFLYFSGMDKNLVEFREVKIPVGDIELRGKLVLPKYAIDENGKPQLQSIADAPRFLARIVRWGLLESPDSSTECMM